MHVCRCGPGGRWWQPTTGFMTIHVCRCGPGGRWWQSTIGCGGSPPPGSWLCLCVAVGLVGGGGSPALGPWPHHRVHDYWLCMLSDQLCNLDAEHRYIHVSHSPLNLFTNLLMLGENLLPDQELCHHGNQTSELYTRTINNKVRGVFISFTVTTRCHRKRPTFQMTCYSSTGFHLFGV